jgi:hypothetical protein
MTKMRTDKESFPVLLTPREVVSALRVDLSLVRLSASPKPPARRKEVPADHEAAVTACASPRPRARSPTHS